MRRRGPLFVVVLIGLACLSAAGCRTAATVAAPLTDTGKIDSGLPLRVAWLANLQPPEKEDLWRPTQYAAPAVAEGAVYLGNTQNQFYAFDARNGDILWQIKTTGPVESAALVVGDAVLVGDGDGTVYCLNRRTGLVRWTYRVQGQVMGRLATNGDLVFVRTNHERVYALTVADGKWKWMQSREVPPGFTIRGVGSPVADGDRLLVGYADGYFLGYRTGSGEELFKTMLEKGDRFIDVDATPVLDDRFIYIASYGGTFYCLSRDNATIQWTHRKGSVERAAIHGDRVFLGDAEGFVRAIEKQTGKELWAFDLRTYDDRLSVAPEPRRRLKTPTNPVPYYGALLVASSSGYFHALDQQTGQPKWHFWPGWGVTAELVIDGNTLYVHSNAGNLYCLKPNYYFHPAQ
jgi:outer membrane protein assembly factor BamB